MKALVFAPHPDDEVLGVGGTIARYVSEGNQVYICIVTRPLPPIYNDEKAFESIRREANAAHEYLGISKTYNLEFPTVMLETVPRHKLNNNIQNVIDEVQPDVVYIPHSGDMQKDHQIVADACMVALRPKNKHIVKRIYAYETLSETGWNTPNIQNEFVPNVYKNISGYLEKKVQAMAKYKSQLQEYPNARSIGAIEVLAKYRGCTVNVEAAEAFVLIREIK